MRPILNTHLTNFDQVYVLSVAQGFIVLQFHGSMNPDTGLYFHITIHSCIQNPGMHGSVVPWFHVSMNL